jgi:hypothetical protein
MAKRRIAVCLLAFLAYACASPQPSADLEAFASASSDPTTFRSQLEESCPELPELVEILEAAISIGAPIYNAGSALGCYRIYEGAAYKLLYQLDDRCPSAAAVIRGGLAKAESNRGANAKAWTMRRTFDAIFGIETSYSGSSL